MKLKYLFVLLLVVSSTNSFSQSPQNWLARVEFNKKRGCIDTNGKEVILARYDDMGFWGAGLISVNVGAKEIDYSKRGGKWGYCNAKGVLVIPLKFDEANTFSEGLAAVRVKDKWGFIDTTGKMVINPQYDDARSFSEGLCAVAKGRRWGFVDVYGKEIIKPEYGEAGAFEDGVTSAFVGKMANSEEEETVGNYCLINKKGIKITEPKYRMIWRFSEGLARVEIADKDDSYETKTGFINTKGEVVVPVIYDTGEDFSEGMAAVGMEDKSESKKYETAYKYGYVNSKGKEIIKIQFSRAGKFLNGKAIVSKGNQRMMGMIYTNGKDNSIINHEDWPKYGVIDKKENYVLDFDWRSLTFVEGDLLIAERARFAGSGVIDITGKIVIPFKYRNLTYAGNQLFIAGGNATDEETTVIDISNKVLFKSKIYMMPSPKYEFGMLGIRTRKLNKSGFVDLKGNLVIKDKYDMIWDFEPVVK